MDPYAPSRYYRSVVGWLGTTVGSLARGLSPVLRHTR